MTGKQSTGTIRNIALLLLLATMVVRTACRYRDVLEMLPILSARPFAAWFRPGLVEAVDWIRHRAPATVRMAAPYQHDSYLYERLGEMLYPIRFLPLTDSLLDPGELCVVPSDMPDMESENSAVVFQNDCVRVLGVSR